MKIFCLLLAICVYTQSFGYYALSATSHTDCHEVTTNRMKDSHACCSSSIKPSAKSSEHAEMTCDTNSESANNCCSNQDSSDEHNHDGGCDGEGCDCHCCFHFHGLHVLYFSSFKVQHLPAVSFYKSKYTFQDALDKDKYVTIFHPPQI